MITKELLPENLIIQYGQLVTCICRKMIQDEETAKDAAQEVWMQVIKSITSFKEQSKLSTWIYSITKRVVIDFAQKERLYTTRYLRNYFRGEEITVPVEIDMDKGLWIKEMCDKCLTGILHCLNNDTRLAYVFRDVAQLTYQEIASIFEKDEATIRQEITRARKKLKNFLNSECTLYNPEGSCKCRMHKLAVEINLPEEYERIRKSVKQINLYLESQYVLPKNNVWENFL